MPSESSNQIEANFFNLKNDKSKLNTTSDVDNWSALPPPYTPSSSSEPSAPPLEYSPPPSQNYSNPPQSYPPEGYHTYPQYGSTLNNPPEGWPWRAPPPNNHHALPPGIPPYEIASIEPRRNKKCTNFFIFLIPLFIFLGFYQFFHSGNTCENGVSWNSLPTRFTFDSAGLYFQVTGGPVTTGTVRFERQEDKSSGVIELEAAVSPELLRDPQLKYALVRDSNGITHLDITLPSSSKRCVCLNAVIYLPYPLEQLKIQAKNMVFETRDIMQVEHLMLQSTNSPIRFHSRWKGKTLLLETTNGRIDVTERIEGEDQVKLATKNGEIRVSSRVDADSVVLSSSNGGIVADQLLSAQVLTATTTNGKIKLDRVKVDRGVVKSTNGDVEVYHGDVITDIDVQTTNARMSVDLNACQYCQVTATTSNAQLKLTLPEDHEGPFDITTSSYHSVQYSDRLNWSKLRFVETNHVSGDRYGPTSTNNTHGIIHAKTTNGNIYASFGRD